MTRRIAPLLAATFLSIAWTANAGAATTERDAAALAGTAVVTANSAQDKGPDSSQCKKDKALFDRLGGFFGIAAVVDRFSDAIIVNPVLNQNPALVAWNQDEAPTRLPGLKFLRTMWIAAMVGGPIKFEGQPLKQAHDRLDLTQAEFAEVGSEIVKAIQHFNVAHADIDQLVCIYQTSMDDVVSSTAAPKEVSPPR